MLVAAACAADRDCRGHRRERAGEPRQSDADRAHSAGSTGGSLVRTIVGPGDRHRGHLRACTGSSSRSRRAVRRRPAARGSRSSRRCRSAPSRSLQLVRAGREICTWSASASTASRRCGAYREDEARRRRACSTSIRGRRSRRPEPRRPVAPGAVAGVLEELRKRTVRAVKLDGHNAVQLLLLSRGITLVPALLFTVTGFTRILIVLGFVRNGLGTPTAPPNQVLVGIAFFLTLFVMAPTLQHDREGRDRAAARTTRSRRAGARARRGAAARVHVQADAHEATSRCSSSLAKIEAAEDARRRPDPRPDPGLHHLASSRRRSRSAS